MSSTDDHFECERCDAVVDWTDARRTETIGPLDPAKWQTLCCPYCGSRLRTLFVGDG